MNRRPPLPEDMKELRNGSDQRLELELCASWVTHEREKLQLGKQKAETGGRKGQTQKLGKRKAEMERHAGISTPSSGVLLYGHDDDFA